MNCLMIFLLKQTRHSTNMKKIFYTSLLLLISTVLLSQIPKKPEPARLVNDFAGYFSPAEVDALERKLVAIDDTTSTQIAVVVIADLNGYDPNMMAYEIGESWGVGQKGKNNGVVILLKPKKGNERGRVAIQAGYGLEEVITDALSKRIIELEMIPSLQQNRPYEAVDKAVNAIVLASKGMYKAAPKKEAKKKSAGVAFLIMIIIVIIISIFNRKNKSNHKTIGGSDIPFWLLMGGLGSGRSSGGGWGNFSSGGGSFGGFGGGSFGGGGASGSW